MSDEKFARYASLEGVPVVISGGAAGIGAAMVAAFAAQGAKVGFVDVNAEAGEALADELASDDKTVNFIECDVTDIAAYRSAIAGFAEAHGPAGVLVNNAAYDGRRDFREIDEEFWDARVAVNLKHFFFAIQAVAPAMIEAGRGSIINFGSLSWVIALPDLAPYAASKAGAHGLTRTIGRDLGKYGIRVNTIVPGWVMTERQLKEFVTPESAAQIAQNQLLADRIMPEDVARMALFLAADDSRMISGQNFTVDGGWGNL